MSKLPIGRWIDKNTKQNEITRINLINADELEKMLDKRISELEKKLEGRMPPSARRINSGKLIELKTIRAMTHLYYEKSESNIS